MNAKAIVISGCVVLILALFLPSFTKMQDLRQRNIELKKELEQLKEKQQVMLKEKRLLLEDPVYSEKVAREKMGLAKEGEVIYRIVPGDEN